ncbi:YybH family protein [Pontibacter toksunensis]|uniref:YybH family protein n=1 Tax=Pontibacter toksunensis TaxID=1332631 RepID=A0ABW6BW38_9BACT
MKPYILILAAAVILSACSSPEEAVHVQDLNKRFISAWNNNSAEEVESLLADDVQFVQGEVHYNGKEEVAEKWVGETLGTIRDLKTNVVSSGEEATIAYEAGTFSVDVLPSGPDQPQAFGEGNFMLLWKKGTDGNWKLSYAQLEDLPVQVKN